MLGYGHCPLGCCRKGCSMFWQLLRLMVASTFHAGCCSLNDALAMQRAWTMEMRCLARQTAALPTEKFVATFLRIQFCVGPQHAFRGGAA